MFSWGIIMNLNFQTIFGINSCFNKGLLCSHQEYEQGFTGGSVVKNPPANAGDTGSSPGPVRSHMLQSN